MRSARRRWLTAITLAVALSSSTAGAQSSAEDEQKTTVQTSQTSSQDDSPGFIDKARRYLERNKLFDRLSGDDDGVYLRFGGMTTGSGLAAGPGFRKHLLDDNLFADVSAAISTKTYKAFDAKVRWARLFNGRVEFWTDFRYEDFPQEDYFGLGGSTGLDMRTNYALESTDIVGRAVVNVAPWLRTGVNIGYFNPTIDHGTDDNYPSIEERFTDIDAPGLTAQPNFLHATVFAEVDLRDRRGSPTEGGIYRASFGKWEDVTLEQFDFHRFDADAGQFYSIFPKHVLAAHVAFSYVNNERGHRVPFYFLAYAGGSDSIRGFREFRFRDENVLYANAEYRWQVLEPLDIAVFFDAGEVQPDWEDIDFQNLKTSYGVGFRLHTEKATFLRFDIGAGGREGTRFFFKLGPSF